MDWEWITGREGEELDGYFPEPDDQNTKSSDYSEDDITNEELEMQEYWDRIFWCYGFEILERRGVSEEDEDYEEIKDKVLGDLAYVLDKEIGDIKSDDVPEILGMLEELGLISDEDASKHIFIRLLNEKLSMNGTDKDICIEGVLMDCYEQMDRYIYVINKLKQAGKIHENEGFYEEFDRERQKFDDFLKTSLSEFSTQEKVEGLTTKLDDYGIFADIWKDAFDRELRRAISEIDNGDNRSVEEVIRAVRDYQRHIEAEYAHVMINSDSTWADDDRLNEKINELVGISLYTVKNEEQITDIIGNLDDFGLMDLLFHGYVEKAKDAVKQKMEFYMNNPEEAGFKTIDSVLMEVLDELNKAD